MKSIASPSALQPDGEPRAGTDQPIAVGLVVNEGGTISPSAGVTGVPVWGAVNAVPMLAPKAFSCDADATTVRGGAVAAPMFLLPPQAARVDAANASKPVSQMRFISGRSLWLGVRAGERRRDMLTTAMQRASAEIAAEKETLDEAAEAEKAMPGHISRLLMRDDGSPCS